MTEAPAAEPAEPAWRWTYRLERVDAAGDDADPADSSRPVLSRADADPTLLDAVAAFAVELGAETFEIGEPSLYDYRPDDEPLPGDAPLARVFGPRLDGFVDGATVGRAEALLLVRELVQGTSWFRLEAAGRMCVTAHLRVVQVDVVRECAQAAAAATAAGLVVTRTPWSSGSRGLPPGWVAEHLRPVDDAFWAEVADVVALHGAAMLHEAGVWNRWYRLTPDRPRVDLHPRSRVSVEADLPVLDLEQVLDDVPDEEGIGALAWVDNDGRAHERWIEGDDLPDLRALLANATRAQWLPFFVEDTPEPYLVGGVPDADGVVRFPYTAWATRVEED
ncbi:hypothetical protein [Cellulomonas cellasea]|uniref:Uncharacterized protein n=1 Tax=Cellulomonas cellasea TaxID=43670 RepID=A0A7W4UHP1_9CELL|nr:hypothetical protein [Cellulomonas cellasea]MBB2924357.1 hypothetical protein [Cellulomonas cellasea]